MTSSGICSTQVFAARGTAASIRRHAYLTWTPNAAADRHSGRDTSPWGVSPIRRPRGRRLARLSAECAPGTVTSGVDTHSDVHVAAAVDHLDGVIGTEQLTTTPAGYRKLLCWLGSFGPLHKVGVEGTGSYGAALARHLAEQDVIVVEVARPNRQVRRRH